MIINVFKYVKETECYNLGSQVRCVCVSIQCLGIPCAFLVYYSASASHTLLLLFWMLRWLRTGLPTCQLWVALFPFPHMHTPGFSLWSQTEPTVIIFLWKYLILCSQETCWYSLHDVFLYWPAWLCVIALEIVWLCLTFLLPVPGCPTLVKSYSWS